MPPSNSATEAKVSGVKRLFALGLLVLSAGCGGPEAPDAAVCQDLIHRLCLPPVCPSVTTTLISPDADCEQTLLSRTGCGDPAFTFSQPTRQRVLDCRAPLLSAGDGVEDAPACADVDETLSCADVRAFLNGETP
jgi:hypothetical protein